MMGENDATDREESLDVLRHYLPVLKGWIHWKLDFAVQMACILCDFVCVQSDRSTSIFRDHLQEKHPQSLAACEAGTLDITDLTDERMTVNQSPSSYDSIKAICKLCFQKFTSTSPQSLRKDLDRHLQELHAESFGELNQPAIDLSPRIKEEEPEQENVTQSRSSIKDSVNHPHVQSWEEDHAFEANVNRSQDERDDELLSEVSSQSSDLSTLEEVEERITPNLERTSGTTLESRLTGPERALIHFLESEDDSLKMFQSAAFQDMITNINPNLVSRMKEIDVQEEMIMNIRAKLASASSLYLNFLSSPSCPHRILLEAQWMTKEFILERSKLLSTDTSGDLIGQIVQILLKFNVLDRVAGVAIHDLEPLSIWEKLQLKFPLRSSRWQKCQFLDTLPKSLLTAVSDSLNEKLWPRLNLLVQNAILDRISSISAPLSLILDRCKKPSAEALPSLGFITQFKVYKHLLTVEKLIEQDSVSEFESWELDCLRDLSSEFKKIYTSHVESSSSQWILPCVLDPLICGPCLKSRMGNVSEWKSLLLSETTLLFPDNAEQVRQEVNFYWECIGSQTEDAKDALSFWRKYQSRLPYLAFMCRLSFGRPFLRQSFETKYNDW